MTFEQALMSGRLMKRASHTHGWKFPVIKAFGVGATGVFGPTLDALCGCRTPGTFTHTVVLTPESVEAKDWIVLMDDSEVEREMSQKEKESTR